MADNTGSLRLYDQVGEDKVSDTFKIMYDLYFMDQVQKCMSGKGAFKICHSLPSMNIEEVFGHVDCVRNIFAGCDSKKVVQFDGSHKYLFLQYDVNLEYFNVICYYDNYASFWNNCLQYKMAMGKDGVPVPIGEYEEIKVLSE
jgi:hypothetical protein